MKASEIEDLETLPHDELVELVKSLVKRNDKLKGKNQQLLREIKDLSGQ